ncbi:DNA repair protein SWI5 homolog [Anthonomus grandis grandis]|uniref:DNA repair protein SWI5 homolog n=1 Tax=Anthonomus grandis grandis TaxID=2921223 RepID=UPI0021664441|nr:DNA repair protein SWI5 homolog [Anthonomus grandis grandis]
MPPKRCTPNSKKRLVKPKVDSSEHLSNYELNVKLRALKKRAAELDKQIAELKAKGVTEDLKPEMQALHEYNETKDATQAVFGYLANVNCVTVTQLYKQYNLPLDSTEE